jgi:hypothetical protein
MRGRAAELDLLFLLQPRDKADCKSDDVLQRTRADGRVTKAARNSGKSGIRTALARQHQGGCLRGTWAFGTRAEELGHTEYRAPASQCVSSSVVV